MDENNTNKRKPWRAHTGYEIFCKLERSRMRESLGDVGSRQINRQLGIKWKSMTKM